MLSRIRWRIALPITALIWITTIITALNLYSVSRESSIQQLESTSQRQLQLLTVISRELEITDSTQEQQEDFLHQWADHLGAHFSIISPEGIVLADSPNGTGSISNQLFRTEIRSADAEGFGSSIRVDSSGGEMYFAAVPLQLDANSRGFLRVQRPLDPIDQMASRVRNQAFLYGGIASILIFGATLLTTNRFVNPLVRLTRSAQRLSAGEMDMVPLLPGQDEIGVLTQALNNLIRRFTSRIQELQSESVTLRAVLDQMTDGVVMINPQGEISLMNPAAEAIFNTTSDQSLGRSVAQILRQHQWIELWRTSTADGQEKSTSLELPSQQTFLQGIAIPLKDILPGYTLLLFQDLSQLRRLETTRQDFISNISHELRTPLASLKALTETLQDGALEDPPAAKRFLSRIDTEVDALTQMVAELLELSRIESGQVPLDLDPVSPDFLLTKAVERMREQAERRRIDVNVDAPSDLVRVKADFRRVEQVLVNLLHNAIKFSPKNRKINLKAYRDGDRMVFSVEDQGPGIPETDLERIFERFYKADQARTGGGTGLGLSISKHLIEAHQGEIWAESRLHHGSKFYFSLPIADQD